MLPCPSRLSALIYDVAQVIEQFKAGTYNVLVSTSIGEEGLDIGEVDLIVCYDAQKTPIRMVSGVYVLHMCLLGQYAHVVTRSCNASDVRAARPQER